MDASAKEEGCKKLHLHNHMPCKTSKQSQNEVSLRAPSFANMKLMNTWATGVQTSWGVLTPAKIVDKVLVISPSKTIF